MDLIETADRPKLTTKQVAQMLGVETDAVQNWARRGCQIEGRVIPLKCIHAGTQYRFLAEDVVEFERACRAAKLGQAFDPGETPAEEAERGRRAVADAMAAIDAA